MTNRRGRCKPIGAVFRASLFALALCAGVANGADRGTLRWLTPDTSVLPLDARFAPPLPLLYLYRQDDEDRLIRIVEGPTGVTVANLSTLEVTGFVDLAPLPGRIDPARSALVLLGAEQTPAGVRGALLVRDAEAGLQVMPHPLRRRSLGLLEVARAGSSQLLAASLGSDGRLVLTRMPEDHATGGVEIDVATPPAPWAAVALPATHRASGNLSVGSDPPGDLRADLALFGVEDDGRVVARPVDTETGSTGTTLSFGRRLAPIDALALPDVFPDGSPELAVLGETEDGRVVGILIKEALTGATASRFRLSPSYQPLALHYLPTGESGGGELLVVGVRSNGALGLQRRSLGNDRAAGSESTVLLKARYLPTDTALMRLGEEGRVVLGLVGVDWRGQFRLEVRDAVSGELLLDSALP